MRNAFESSISLSRRGGATRPGHLVAQRRTEPLEDRGGEQEVVDLGGLARQHLGRQVVDDVALVAGERLDELVSVVSSPQREGRQVETGRPALGPLHEPGHVRGVEVEPLLLVEQVVRLGDGEPELGVGDLEQLAPGPQPGDGQRWLHPGGEHQLESGRRMVQQEVTASCTSALAIRW